MFEIEIKVAVKSPEETEKKLLDAGFCRQRKIREEDRYYDDASGRIKDRGQALRIRKIRDLESGNEEAVITFKGKKMDTVSKSRKELETALGHADTAMEILGAIGFLPVDPAVVKTRTEYGRGQMNACLDHVEGLGDFLELEIVVARREDKDAATDALLAELAQLGYSLQDSIQTSYLGLLS